MSNTINPIPIFLDYHSTTPMDRRIAEAMLRSMTDHFGNASSADHLFGDHAAKDVLAARDQVASLLNSERKAVIFTSGATESINLGISGFCRRAIKNKKRVRVGLSRVEHRAVLETCQALADSGIADLIWLRVDQLGRISLDEVESCCKGGLDLLCIMAANNEIGNVYPFNKIGAIAERYGVTTFCDGTQAVGKVPFDFRESRISMLAFSAHKIYGPKGVGALLLDDSIRLENVYYGGPQERGIRPGTINVPGVVGLGLACRYRQQEMTQDESRISVMRDHLRDILLVGIPDLKINGDQENKLAGNLHISIRDTPNDAVIARVRHRLAVSSGAACASGVITPSHVLRAIGLDEEWSSGSLRLSVGKFTTSEEIEEAGSVLSVEVRKVRDLIGNSC